MTTDVDVQYFSHLNGLTLGNNWGDLIRLLDKALVTGIDFTQITAASIDAQGDVRITLYAAHNAMLFQVVELIGFTPISLNQKYRIKGVPSATELILKPHTAIVETSITTVGAGKLASLGYEIIFRDTNDVKRVYRAKNPTAQHPFIRVDESLTSPDGTTGVYTSTYAKSAMVGLLEHIEHIDDYENPNFQQLPFDQSDPAKNWKITGTGTGVVRGWSKWYWAAGPWSSAVAETASITNGNRNFTLIGDQDAFYIQRSVNPSANVANHKYLMGCGLFDGCTEDIGVANWFLMTTINDASASKTIAVYSAHVGGMPLVRDATVSRFIVSKYDGVSATSNHTTAIPILPSYDSGFTDMFGGAEVGALQIPLYDTGSILRGNLKHVHFSGKALSLSATTSIMSADSLYVADGLATTGANIGSLIYYLGEI